MQGLANWLNTNKDAVMFLSTAIIGLVAAVIITLLVVKAIAAAKKSKMNDVMKHVGFAAIVVLLSIMGVAGLQALIESVAPEESILPRGNASSVVNAVDTAPAGFES